MKTGPDCLVCFYRQALNTARLSTADPEVHYRVLERMGQLLPTLEQAISPPENAVRVYSLIAEETGIRDPYLQLKRKSNDFVLGRRAEVERIIAQSPDPLWAAVRFAIGANIIDYGVHHRFDEESTIKSCLQQELVIDEFHRFKQEVSGERNLEILYLADNTGEIVFDMLLVKQLLALGCRVTMVVREQVILNDATLADAEYCGIPRICPVITNGTGCPGTPLAVCTRELRERFAAADLIVSKGQGNFETLSEVAAPIYFFLTVKCPVVADHIRTRRNLAPDSLTGQGEPVLMKQEL